MSLKAFHIVFITLSGILSAGLFLWGIQGYREGGSNASLVLGVVGLVCLALLVPYGRWFLRKMKRLSVWILPAGALVLWTDPVWACAACYGNPNSPLTKGMKMGILSLTGLVYLILFGILYSVFTMVRRAKKNGL